MRIYRKGTKLPKKLFNFNLSQGGLGDLLGQLPAIKFVLDYHVNVYINLFVHSYAVDLCKKAFESYGDRITVDAWDNAARKYFDNLQARTPYAPHLISNLSWHITEHAFATLVGRSVTGEFMNYIKLDPIDVSEFNLPKRYAAVTTGYTSKTRVFKGEYVNEISDYLNSIGITPVFLGKKATYADKNNTIVGNFEGDYTKGVDLIDKTNLFEAHSIMANAEFVLGVDNGLLHLASLSDVPVIWGFTSVLSEHRLPYRHDKLGWNAYVVQPTEEELGCVGCQSKQNFADPAHSFTKCIYTDYKCVELMTSDKWITQIDKALEPKTPQEKAERAYQTIKNTQALNKKLKELGIGIK